MSRIFQPFRNPHEVKLNIRILNGRVCFQFHRPVDVFHVSADEARGVAKALLEHADKLDGRESPILVASH